MLKTCETIGELAKNRIGAILRVRQSFIEEEQRENSNFYLKLEKVCPPIIAQILVSDSSLKKALFVVSVVAASVFVKPKH
jgi:hypothetical protein